MARSGNLRFEFRVLGPFEVVSGGRVVEIGSAKQRALLALLVTNLNRPVSLDGIGEALWEGRPPASLASTVQSLVYRLRKLLTDADAEAAGIALRGRGSGYVLEGEQLQVDGHRFEQLVARGRELAATGAADAAARAFRDALGLWRGSALDGLTDLAFARVEATRLEEARLGAVEGLADAELTRGHPEEALGLLEAHVAANPLREAAWGQLMLTLYRLGRQAEALRAYQEVRRILGEELGLEPNPALRQLDAQILAQSPDLRNDTAPPSPPVAVARTPLVGREVELDDLRSALRETIAGSGRIVMLSGEPGIGKTRLTEELAAEGLRSRVLVFVGRCLEAEGAPPYAPFVEILESALARAPSPEAFRAAAGEAAPEIARLVPRLRRLFPDIGPALNLPPEQERRYLFNSVADMLARSGRTVPTVVVLEDLHWADEATLLLLDHLARHLAGAPVLIVGTYRDVELDMRPALARTVDGLVRERLVKQLHLPRLREAALAQMLGALAGQQPPEAVVGLVFRETEGNPFFVEEVFLSDRGGTAPRFDRPVPLRGRHRHLRRAGERPPGRRPAARPAVRANPAGARDRRRHRTNLHLRAVGGCCRRPRLRGGPRRGR
jgi:DNA-binding SARP family transcriptional activator